MAIDKGRAAQLVDAGIWLRLSGDLDGARKLFERALKLDPENEKAKEFLGQGAAPAASAGATSPSAVARQYAPPPPGTPSWDSVQTPPHATVPPRYDPVRGSFSVSSAPQQPESPQVPLASPPMFSDSAFRTAAAASHQWTAPASAAPAPPSESPPGLTPSMFEGGGGPPAAPPVTEAWNYKTSSPPKGVTAQPSPGEASDAWATSFPPAPKPSPVDPNARSGWDRKSQPGVKIEIDTTQGAVDFNLVSGAPKVSSVSSGTRRRADEVAALLRGARDLIELDDHTGAMDLISKAQTLDPENAEIKSLLARSEKTLLTMLEGKLGNLEATPRVLLKDDEIIWLNLDHRAGFVLAQIDGTVTFEDLFAVSGMARLDTARILAQLIEQGVISRG